MEKTLTHAKRFQWLNVVLADPAFTDAQARVLVRLCLYLHVATGQCNPSIDELASCSAQKPGTVWAAIKAAEAAGLLTREGGGGRGRHNAYKFRLPENGETLHGGEGFPETLHPETLFGDELNPSPPRPKPFAAAKSHIKKNMKNKKEHADADFERWYQVYPRRCSRGAAEKAFHRVLEAGQATLDELIAGATRYAEEVRGQEPRFTKHPATWLNGQCWLDEAPAQQQNGQPDKIAAAGGGRVVPRL